MRLLQLATGPNQILDLHPNLSIVTGLDDDSHTRLVDAVARLARAEAAAGGGLLEAHGVLFDLDPALLSVIESTDGDLDPIVHPGQLPSQPISVDARELHRQEQEFSALLEQITLQAEKQSLARGALAAATAALEGARRARAGAEVGATRRLEDIDRLTRRLDQLAAQVRRVEEALTELRPALSAALAARAEDGHDAELEPVAVRLERLDGRNRELDHLLTVVIPVERFAIEEALAMLEGGESADLVPSGEAAALADELDRIGAELGDPGASGGDEVGETSLADARTRLDDATRALLEAEQAVRNPELDRDDVFLLEDTHAELLDAVDKVAGRFARARATSRVVELRTMEQDVLDRLGFTSYSDYMMGYSLLHVDPVKEEALDAARAELAAAEDDRGKLEQDTEAALVRAALLDRRRGLLEQARELLGRVAPGARPQEALRGLLVPAVSTRESARRLHALLETVGVELGDEDPDHEELCIIAETWLDEVGQVDGRRQAALEERAALEAERAALLVEPDADAYRGAGAEPDAAEASLVADAEISAALATEAPLAERVLALEAELLRAHDEAAETDEALRERSGAVLDLATLDADIEAAEACRAESLAGVETEDRALAGLDAQGRAAALEIERLQDIVAAHGTGTATPAEELEWYLLARVAAQRAVSVAGSVPLLLNDALRGLAADEVGHLLGRLERVAEAVQVIIISEDPVVASWAHLAGPARAAVVSPSAP